MCNNLRKIIFSLGTYEFDPDASPAQEEEMKELCRERRGFFHRWTEDVDNSKDIPFVKAMALVEDADTGQIHVVEYHNIRFTID